MHRKKIKKIAQGLKNTLCSIYQIFHQKYLQQQLQNKQNQAYINKASLDSYVYSIMTVISTELFQAFSGKHFMNIAPIHTPSDFRIADYQVCNGCYIYHFHLTKQNYDKYAVTVLNAIKENMQRDIYRFHNELINYYGIDYVESCYPFIYYGLYLIKLEDIGDAVRLSVVSHFYPEKYF